MLVDIKLVLHVGAQMEIFKRPSSLAFSTNHHHEPVASTAIFVPVGSFLKTP